MYASEDLKALYRRDLPAGAVDQRRVLNYADDTFKLYNNTYQFPGKSMWVAYTQPNLGMNSTEFFSDSGRMLCQIGRWEQMPDDTGSHPG